MKLCTTRQTLKRLHCYLKAYKKENTAFLKMKNYLIFEYYKNTLQIQSQRLKFNSQSYTKIIIKRKHLPYKMFFCCF